MAREGHEVQALAEKPNIDTWSWIWHAWTEMSGDRANGGATSWLTADFYARRYGIEDDDYELFMYGIRILDVTAIDYQNKRQKEQHERISKQQKKALKKQRKK